MNGSISWARGRTFVYTGPTDVYNFSWVYFVFWVITCIVLITAEWVREWGIEVREEARWQLSLSLISGLLLFLMKTTFIRMQEKGKLTEYLRILVKCCAGAAYLWLSFNATKVMDLQEMSHKSNLILPFCTEMDSCMMFQIHKIFREWLVYLYRISISIL